MLPDWCSGDVHLVAIQSPIFSQESVYVRRSGNDLSVVARSGGAGCVENCQ
jgi:hypothetical protein